MLQAQTAELRLGVPVHRDAIQGGIVQHDDAVGVESQSFQRKDRVVRLYNHVVGVVPVRKYRVGLFASQK